MLIPSQIQLSSVASDKFRVLKMRTGLTPNILSRFAIMLAIDSNANVETAAVEDSSGQIIGMEVMCGENTLAYDCFLKDYIRLNSIQLDIKKIIPALIEIGAHKMGHIKSIEDLIHIKD